LKSTEGYKHIFFAKGIEIRYFVHSFTSLNHEAMNYYEEQAAYEAAMSTQGQAIPLPKVVAGGRRGSWLQVCSHPKR